MKNESKPSFNFNKLGALLFLLLSLLPAQLLAQSKIKHLISLEPYFSHHLIVAEKLTHQMHLIEVTDSDYKILKS